MVVAEGRLVSVARAASHPWGTLQVLYADLLDVRATLKPDPVEHLDLAMVWLCLAQDRTSTGGVSAGYDRLRRLWEPPYPETTGYLIPTFLQYAGVRNDGAFVKRAVQMADWLVSLQAPDGSFPARVSARMGGTAGAGAVFDTGMILEGLTCALASGISSTSHYEQAAALAARWLQEVQNPDGSWSRDDYYGAASTYHAKVAASLARYGESQRDESAVAAAVRHVEWVVRHQDETGWFSKAGFGAGENPWLHTVAYVIEGVLDTGIVMKSAVYVDSATRAAWQLLRRFEVRRRLAGRFTRSWQAATWSRCLPGEAQMALIWLKLYRHSGDARFLNAALKLNDELRQLQCVTAPRNWLGALAGSCPFSRGYAAWKYPNWAAKFFCDSLMLERELLGSQ